MVCQPNTPPHMGWTALLSICKSIPPGVLLAPHLSIPLTARPDCTEALGR
jgi:hypothetical protein